MMQARTTAIIDTLGEAVWFQHVGAPASEAVVVLPSWEAAFESAATPEWKHVRLEAANVYCERLVVTDRARFVQWNHVVREVKPVVVALVERKLEEARRSQPWPKGFVDAVNWDILHRAMESEYDDVVPGQFYVGLADWYLQGRFPCGWQGDFPEGKQVVF